MCGGSLCLYMCDSLFMCCYLHGWASLELYWYVCFIDENKMLTNFILHGLFDYEYISGTYDRRIRTKITFKCSLSFAHFMYDMNTWHTAYAQPLCKHFAFSSTHETPQWCTEKKKRIALSQIKPRCEMLNLSFTVERLCDYPSEAKWSKNSNWDKMLCGLNRK